MHKYPLGLLWVGVQNQICHVANASLVKMLDLSIEFMETKSSVYFLGMLSTTTEKYSFIKLHWF